MPPPLACQLDPPELPARSTSSSKAFWPSLELRRCDFLCGTIVAPVAVIGKYPKKCPDWPPNLPGAPNNFGTHPGKSTRSTDGFWWTYCLRVLDFDCEIPPTICAVATSLIGKPLQFTCIFTGITIGVSPKHPSSFSPIGQELEELASWVQALFQCLCVAPTGTSFQC